MIMACIVSAVSAISLFACMLEVINKNKIVVVISKILTIVAFVMGIIGVTIGIVLATETGYLPIKASIDVAAILAIVALSINFIGAISTLIIH